MHMPLKFLSIQGKPSGYLSHDGKIGLIENAQKFLNIKVMNDFKVKSVQFCMRAQKFPCAEFTILGSHVYTQFADSFIHCVLFCYFGPQLKTLNEIKIGAKNEYRVWIKTGNRQGSGTNATIKIQIFGKKGKTGIVELKQSITNRIPFQRGKQDVFKVDNFDVGGLTAISIGHTELDLSKNIFIMIFSNCNGIVLSFGII
jgi:hypothetical protein